MKTIKFTNEESRYILGELSRLIEDQNERIRCTRTWMETDKRDLIDEVEKLARGFFGKKRRYISGCLSGLLGNQVVDQSNPIELKLTWLVASCTSNMIDEVAALSAKLGKDVVTNIATTLVDHTVWEVTSFKMVKEMVETFPCYLVFNSEW